MYNEKNLKESSSIIALGGTDGTVSIWVDLKPITVLRHIFNNTILDLKWDNSG